MSKSRSNTAKTGIQKSNASPSAPLPQSNNPHSLVIQCPACQTRFAVESAQLRGIAKPRFHCSRCSHYFGIEDLDNNQVEITSPSSKASGSSPKSMPSQLPEDERRPKDLLEKSEGRQLDLLSPEEQKRFASNLRPLSRSEALPVVTADWPDSEGSKALEADLRSVAPSFADVMQKRRSFSGKPNVLTGALDKKNENIWTRAADESIADYKSEPASKPEHKFNFPQLLGDESPSQPFNPAEALLDVKHAAAELSTAANNFFVDEEELSMQDIYNVASRNSSTTTSSKHDNLLERDWDFSSNSQGFELGVDDSFEDNAEHSAFSPEPNEEDKQEISVHSYATIPDSEPNRFMEVGRKIAISGLQVLFFCIMIPFAVIFGFYYLGYSNPLFLDSVDTIHRVLGNKSILISPSELEIERPAGTMISLRDSKSALEIVGSLTNRSSYPVTEVMLEALLFDDSNFVVSRTKAFSDNLLTAANSVSGMSKIDITNSLNTRITPHSSLPVGKQEVFRIVIPEVPANATWFTVRVSSANGND